ncbi:LysM peptidoglycan-binding domain-containing protein [Aeromonas taiwanensis]|uniref:LysM peptidoglycan-binding domain-containing protein n=1 Tax=Aeromonas taiwanensis TaxID=633417 RepID=UPI00207C204D|nr:LysM peptidoglycan-binding domain-containing protein [Aeromonas taiwanensis]MCO4203172.1 LysM peptidoglycan-binding domain-containing protein [Aeromonas taiwanensis]
MCSRVWQGSGVVVLSWLLLACSSSKTAAPVHSLGNDQIASTIPVRQGVAKSGIQGSGYTVVKGDTLYSIAFRSGMDVDALISMNGITPPYNIYPGQQLRLDGSAPTAVASVGSPVSRGSVTGTGSYQVRRGDTLSSIGRQFGVSNQVLAQRNNLQAPYDLHVGQVLNVGAAGASSGQMVAAVTPTVTSTGPKPLATAPAGTTTPFIAQKTIAPAPSTAYAQAKEQKSVSSPSTLSWHWPTKGRIVEGFSVAEQGNKGIDISGQKGQPIYAASGGKVVYAGSALRGYGKLIILKHNDDYLSAYAHNDELRVKEGDSVKGGAVIANMGSTDAPDVRLHFEIRYKGKSINPMGYLPKR